MERSKMDIPVFPQFKPLELADKEEIESFLKKAHPETSDYSFVNFFIWRHYDQPKLTTLNGNLGVLLSPADNTPYFLPPVGGEKTEETLKAFFGHLKKLPQLRGVPERFAKKYFDGKIDCWIELDRANADYIYKVSDLVNLKGRKYDGKRNWIKKFFSSYASIEYVPLTKERVPEALQLLEKWGKTRSGTMLKYEIQAIKEVLDNFEPLGLVVRAVLVDGKMEAFMAGGELNPEMGIVYIQVANREAQGLPQYFHRRYAAEEFAKYKYSNWEQDLAIPGLRKAKLSYHPCRLAHKYNVSKG